ncbi:MAG TPA: DNA polymerase IV [Patescibacteria group bacterium]|nr:DNA polymerase IV [Patescibacteria group bacterium]
MPRVILHIDFDSFFASCEQHFNPNLRHKPIGVTAQNGRNCIIAASREAKRLGLKSPGNTWNAKRLIPDIIFVKADFERYLDITKKLLEISTRYSPLVELFSLDEVFIDLTPVNNLYPSPLFVAESFKKDLRKEVGETITVSIGSSYNKLLAKLATNLNKPDGFAQIDKENRQKVFANLSLTDIMGIGHGFERRLNMMGIFTFKELEDCPLYVLRAEFGKVAAENLKRLSMGIDDSPVVSYLEDNQAKSVGRNYCLPENNYNKENILKNIYELSEEIAIKLRRLEMKGRTIGLYLHGDKSEGGRRTIPKYTDSSSDIFEICKKFFTQWNMDYVRQISVWVGNLVEDKYTNLSLFENPKQETIRRLMDNINERFGHHTIRNGYLIDAPVLHTKPNGYMADRGMRKDLATLGRDNL